MFWFQPLLKQQCSQTIVDLIANLHLFQPLLKQQCSQTSGEAIAQKFRSNHYSNSSALKPNQYNSLSPLRKTGT